jgi:hypothetical protein
MVRRLHFPALCVGAAVVFGVLVFMAFGRDHTKVVTKTRTQVVNTRFDGTITSLTSYLAPTAGGKVECPASVPKNAVCYQLGGANFFVFVAMPADPAAS